MSFRFPAVFHLILAGACLLPSSPGAVELPREAGDVRVAAEWVKVATARSPEHGLSCASRLDSDVAWKAFGASVQRGDDAATRRSTGSSDALDHPRWARVRSRPGKNSGLGENG